jgi:hypothetical protein
MPKITILVMYCVDTCTTQNLLQTCSTNILHVSGKVCPRGSSNIFWMDKKEELEKLVKISKSKSREKILTFAEFDLPVLCEAEIL